MSYIPIIDIDFDFFCVEHADFKGDCGEGLNPVIQMIQWISRCSNACTAGVDLVDLLTSKVDVPPSEFWQVMGQIFNFADQPSLLYSDSHATIGSEFFWYLPPGQKYEVWHFDAHHDLFYSQDKKFEEYCNDRMVNCGNWLGVSSRIDQFQRIKRINIVYPNWRKPGNNPTDPDNHLTDASAERQQYLTGMFAEFDIEVNWYYWEQVQSMRIETPVQLITTCLSSGWTPPWLDSSFKALLLSAPTGELYEMEESCWEYGFKCREIQPGVPWQANWEWICQQPAIYLMAEGWARFLTQQPPTE